MKIMDNPYPETPGQREAQLSKIVAFVESSPEIPVDLKPEIKKRAHDLLRVEVERAPESFKFYGGQLGWTHWVIRDDQLNLMTALAPGAVGVATYATAAITAANPIVLAVTLLFSALAVGSRLKDKSAVLEEKDYHVLMTLKRIGPATPLALTNFLNGVRIFGAGIWNEEQTLAILQKLKAITVRDGSVDAFVTQASDGRFSTNGI
jgi:hypothetical protein